MRLLTFLRESKETLSTHNLVFAKLLAQILNLWAHFPDNQIKMIRLDNAGESISKLFLFCNWK